MPPILWRILIAVFAWVVLWMLLPPLLRVFGLMPGADIMFILRVCLGALAACYILWGRTWTPSA